MMTAELSSNVAESDDLADLTSQQKYNRISPKQTIEVRIAGAAVNAQWLQAKVINKNKGGCYCKLLTSSTERFFHWHDVRPLPNAEKPKITATIGEIIRSHSADELPRKTPMPPPPQLAQAIAPRPAPPTTTLLRVPPAPPPPQKAAILISREDLFMSDPPPANARAAALPIRGSKSREARDTEIGELIKGERLRRQITQLELAQLMNAASKSPSAGAVYNSRISRIEFGKSLPTDDELVAFAEVLKLDLDALIAARDRDQAEQARFDAAKIEEARKQRARDERRAHRHAQALREGRVIHERPGGRKSIEAAPIPEKPAPQKTKAARFVELAELVEAMIEIVPMPLDPELRKRWFQCVKELFKLSGAD